MNLWLLLNTKSFFFLNQRYSLLSYTPFLFFLEKVNSNLLFSTLNLHGLSYISRKPKIYNLTAHIGFLAINAINRKF